MKRLYALNRWYDRQREPLRFLLFIVPCLSFWCMLTLSGSYTVRITGVMLFGTFATLRMIPMLFRRPTDDAPMPNEGHRP